MLSYLQLLPVESVLFAGGLTIGTGLVLALLPHRSLSRMTWVFPFAIQLALLAGAGVSVLLQTNWTFPLAILASLWGLGWLLRSHWLACWAQRTVRLLGNHYLQASSLVLVGFGLLLGWVAFQDASTPTWPNAEDLATDVVPALKPLDHKARSDRGRDLVLFHHADVNQAPSPAKREADYLHRVGRSLSLIRTGDPSLTTNCHGWVFTGGYCWVKSETVPHILADNGYRLVSDPTPGDVVIYRDHKRDVIHTGLVRSVASDGLILVESKWGQMGRFLHTPDQQNYSSQWEFYRTSRGSHLLQNLPGSAPSAMPPSTTASGKVL